MGQNNFILDEIDHEATKVLTDTHHHNWLPGKDIPIKTSKDFLTIACKLYLAILKLTAEN